MIGASATACVVLIGLVGPTAFGRVDRPAPESSEMNTLFLLMVQYKRQAVSQWTRSAGTISRT